MSPFGITIQSSISAVFKRSIRLPHTPSNMSGLRLYIIFSLGIQEASSLSQREGEGGFSFFQLRAMHLLAIIKAILMNLTLLPLTGSIEVSPSRVNLGSGRIFILTTLSMVLSIVSQ